MEKEKQSPSELSSRQFRQQLNEVFEQHGVVDNLRSHLRSLMITSLQRMNICLKPPQKSSPKAQSINLLVAEYLLRHGCHYTLSVLMSELPSLANFGYGAGVLHPSSRPCDKKKSPTKYRFQESEVVEILNSMGLSSQEETLKSICDLYVVNGEEESLLECLLRLLPKIQPSSTFPRCEDEDRRRQTKEWYVQVSDLLLKAGKSPPEVSTALQSLSKMMESGIRKAAEEESNKRVRELVEREMRIQEQLRSHEDEVLGRLREAEKELNARRDKIEREITERQVHLGRIAFQWKDKHSEILALSKTFQVVKSENVSLRARVDALEAEVNELRLEVKSKAEAIERLEEEKMTFKCHAQEYLKWKSRRNSDRGTTTTNLCDGAPAETSVRQNAGQSEMESKEAVNLNVSSSEDEDFPLSESNSREKLLLDRIKARLETLEEETSRINEKYSKYRKKYEDTEGSNCESLLNFAEEGCTEVNNNEDLIVFPVELSEPKVSVKERELEEDVLTQEEYLLPVEETRCKRREGAADEAEHLKGIVPTKRQEKNLQFFLKTRNLLEMLEKHTGLVNESRSATSVSTCDASASYSSCNDSAKDESHRKDSGIPEGGVSKEPNVCTAVELKMREKDGNVEHVPCEELSERETDKGGGYLSNKLSDVQCLTLLKEMAHPTPMNKICEEVELLQPCRLPGLCGFLPLCDSYTMNMRKHSTESEYQSGEIDEELHPPYRFKFVNEVRLLGFVGCIPKQSSGALGPYTTFSIATSKYFRDNTGSMKQITNWHFILVKDISLQDYVVRYISKGTRAYVSGSLSNREHNSELSSLTTETCVVANQVIALKKSTRDNFEI